MKRHPKVTRVRVRVLALVQISLPLVTKARVLALVKTRSREPRMIVRAAALTQILRREVVQIKGMEENPSLNTPLSSSQTPPGRDPPPRR